METFSALLALCAGNSPVTGEFPAQRPVARRFDVFFDLRPNKRLSKQWWGWWFETPSRPLWRHCNIYILKQSSSYRINLKPSVLACCKLLKLGLVIDSWWRSNPKILHNVEFAFCFVKYNDILQAYVTSAAWNTLCNFPNAFEVALRNIAKYVIRNCETPWIYR